MITKEQKFRLGVFSAASLALLILLLALLIVPAFRDRGLPYVIVFTGTSVNGLDVGASVKYQGVQVGKVTAIRVDPDDLSSILVRVHIDRSFPVRTDMTATMTYAGITGAKFIEVMGGPSPGQPIPADGEIPAARGLGEKAEDIVANIDSAVRGINNLLGPANQKRLNEFLLATQQSADVVSRVLRGKEENLARSIDNIEKASLDFGAVTENLRKITADLSGLTDKLDVSAGVALDNLNKRFSDAEMGQVVRNLDSFIATASSSLKKIENVLIIQQEDLRHAVDSMGLAIENLSRFSRDLLEDPALFLRSRKGKK